jgi:serine phosphatase RsbU (regulator of sigma subunit)
MNRSLFLNNFHFTLLCVLFSIFLLNKTETTAQNRTIDSLVHIATGSGPDTLRIKTLGKLSWEYTKIGRFEDARKETQEALKLADNLISGSKGTLKNQLLVLKGKALNDLGINAFYEGNYTDALNSYLDELKLFTYLGNKKHMAICHGNIGLIYKNMGNYPQALKEYFSELSTAGEIGYTVCQADAYVTLGEVYRLQGSYTDALKNHFASLELRKKLGDKDDLAASYTCIALVYSDLHKYSEALKNDSFALALFRQTNNTFKLPTLYMNMASCFDDLNDVKQAQALYTTALHMKEAQEDQRGMAECYVNMGHLAIKNKELDKAREYLEKATHIGETIAYKDALRESYNSLSIIDSLRGNYKNGWKHYVGYIRYRDSLFNEDATRRTTQAQMQYDFDRKESSAKAIQEKKDAVELEEKNKQVLLRNSFIGGFTLTSLLGLVMYSGYRRKRKDNALLENKNKVIAHQKEVVEEKQKEIIDSITYAKRLQEAILPTPQSLKRNLPGSFVFYLPKDIVAGDFYWMEKNNDTLFIAAADCTGHGVPGALVSVVCSNALNRAVKEFGISEPGLILDKTAELVKETFSKSEADVKDGMDISLLAMKKNGEVKWAGAYNPLWVCSNGVMQEIGADKQPVGKTDSPHPFSTHILQLKPGDNVYLFTDGFADQFGGPKGKKYKYKPLQELLRNTSGLTPAEQKHHLQQAFLAWKGNLEQVDDVCIIGIKIL